MVPLLHQYSEPYVASIPESPLQKVENLRGNQIVMFWR